MKPVVTGCCALAGKAGGAIRVCFEFFGSFLFGAKKERKDKSVVKEAIKDFEKVDKSAGDPGSSPG